MKKNFNQYIKVPLSFFLIALVFSTASVLNVVISFKNQHYYYCFGSIPLAFLALIFLFLAIYFFCSNYKERKKDKNDRKIFKGENC